MLTEPPAGWVRPWWAERQLDPGSAAYAPEPSQVRYWLPAQQVSDSVLANTAGRSWTTIGLPETLDRAAVDPRGLVVLGCWSLDWWVRAGDEWVFPSRAAAVRQRLVEGMPVVETILRVGGGDVVHRAAAARGASVRLDDAERHVKQQRRKQVAGDGTSAVPEVFVVEITNRTDAPVAVALAARPYHLGAFEHADGEIWGWSNAWGIDEISVDNRVTTIDDGLGHAVGRAAVIFDRTPGDIVVGSDGADCAGALVEAGEQAAAGQESSVAVSIGGAAPPSDHAASLRSEPASIPQPERAPVSVTDPQRMANAAAVFPLVAGATLRTAVVGRGSAFEWDDAGSPALGAAVLDAVPSLDRVANGWSRRVDAGCRLELPGGRLADAALAARSAQLLSTAPFDDGPGVVGPMLASALDTDAQFAGDDLVQLLALVEAGVPQQVRDLLLRQAQAQDYSGATTSMGVSVTGTSLVLAEHLLSLHPDPALAEGISEFVTAAARRLLTRDAEHREEAWTIREGLRAGYRLLFRLGAERAATALQREAMSLPEVLRVEVGDSSATPARSRRRRRAGPHAARSGTGINESSSFYRDRSGRLPWEVSSDTSVRARSTAQFAWRETGETASSAESEQPDRRWEWVSHDTGLWIHAAVPWAPPLPFVGAEPADGTPADFVDDTAASCGHDMVATALLAFAEARPAPGRAFDRLEALVSVASPTLNWPTYMHPALRTGTNGTGHDLMVGGLFVRTLLRLLVDVPDDGPASSGGAGREPARLRLAAYWPATWLGQPVEVHHVPTAIGAVSWAVRWHGERPALLWDVVPHDPGGDPPSVTAPGLDPAFTATGWQGEALLAPPPVL
ncbi:hypothetical protein [Candidatus Poriferisodalis sp.]|uniref:hypothetical protein n=1 Tax=Candidatus Poriferisodalis sp. TaxID=3101277 RepID=UPI003B02ABB0